MIETEIVASDHQAGPHPLPDGWRWVRLGDVGEAIRGVTFQSHQATKKPSDGYIACLTTSGVQEKVNWASRCYIPRLTMTSDNQLLRKGDLLVSTANSKALVGKSCLVEDVPEASTFGAFVTVIRAKEVILPIWVAFWLRSPDSLEYCYQMSSNTTNISNLRVSDLMDMPIPLPPLAEQRRIAAILAGQMAAVEHARAATETQLAAARALPAAFLREVFESDEAREWESKPLRDLAEIVGGMQKTPSRRPQHFHAPYLTVRNVLQGALDLTDVEQFEITSEELEKLRLLPDDILVVEGNGSSDQIGRNAVFHGEIMNCVHQNHVIRVRISRQSARAEFVSIFLNSSLGRRQISEKAMSTTGLHTLSVSKVGSLEIPLPPVAEQQRIVAILSERMAGAETLRATLEAQLDAIDTLPAALLRQAFNGEL